MFFIEESSDSSQGSAILPKQKAASDPREGISSGNKNNEKTNEDDDLRILPYHSSSKDLAALDEEEQRIEKLAMKVWHLLMLYEADAGAPTRLDILKLGITREDWAKVVLYKDDNERLPIHWACRLNGSVAAIKFLLDYSPQTIFSESSEGKTPLHYACEQRCSASVIGFLVDRMKDTTALNGWKNPRRSSASSAEIIGRRRSLALDESGRRSYMSRDSDEDQFDDDFMHDERVQAIEYEANNRASFMARSSGSFTAPRRRNNALKKGTSFVVGRGVSFTGSLGGDDMSHGFTTVDESEKEDDSHEEVPHIPFYSVPVQRQRWGEVQVLPHINWGDLFFDLFYVAAAYNLGAMLVSSMNSKDWARGVIYFVGIFGPIYNVWNNQVLYVSMYTVADFAHKLIEMLRCLVLTVAVVHIKPIEFLADSKSIETFCLVSCLLVLNLIDLGLQVELIRKADGDRLSIRRHTMNRIKVKLTFNTFLLASVILSCYLFFAPSSTPYNNQYDDYWNLSDLPLTLSCGAYLLRCLHEVYEHARGATLDVNDIPTTFVPNNIDYMIHRYGEWVMLMIGESIISITHVEITETSDYYVVVLVGALTVIIFQALKYESDPHSANHHALRRSMLGAISYQFMVQLLSMGLIAVSICVFIYIETFFSVGISVLTHIFFLHCSLVSASRCS